MAKTKLIAFRATEEEHSEYKALAEKKGYRSISEFLRQLLKLHG